MSVIAEDRIHVWKETPFLWASLAFVSLLIGIIYYDSLELMVMWWNAREEYGHGFIIPFVILFLIWQKSDKLEQQEFKGSWLGVVFVCFGLALFYVGELSSIYTIIQYAFVLAFMGVALSVMGKKAFMIIVIPLTMLFFMIPLPNFIFFNLSSYLQLISSQIGVAIIRLFDISVYLEGNVIDLGVYKLQVVEACSGLNYLFPLMTLGFITAYIFTGALWKKALIFLSTIPITVLMNSFRIGVIGVMVENWGNTAAEGFLHDFEGWVIFMSCIVLLIMEMWVLTKIGKDKLLLKDAFGLDTPEPIPSGAEIRYRNIPKQFYVSLGLIAVVALSATAIPEREEDIPDRKYYTEFPMHLNGWTGTSGSLKKITIEALKLTDYAMINYKREDNSSVNFYSAYYDSQKKGASAHSPRSCIPGGGWRIISHEVNDIKKAINSNKTMKINRLVIIKGDTKQLVYYWFQQRGRVITNEYLMKWYLFWDAMTKNRTDGALMRLTTTVPLNDSLQKADERLLDFISKISPIVSQYVPD